MREQNYWLVGASLKSEDQTDRFVKEGVWETIDNSESTQKKVKEIQKGDHIAIKTRTTIRPKESNAGKVPFDLLFTISAMEIKAVGTVLDNPGDGIHVKVEWKKIPPRTWFFNSFRQAIQKITPDDRKKNWMKDNMMAFVFENKKQDIDRFRNDPRWRDRHGHFKNYPFTWIHFYEAMANQIRKYKNNRNHLVQIIDKIASHSDLTIGFGKADTPLKDICPFTIMGLFNRIQISDETRRRIATELAKALGVNESVPNDFSGIPMLLNTQPLFFDSLANPDKKAIDSLWALFDTAISCAKDLTAKREKNESFQKAYDNALKYSHLKRTLSLGLFWIRPWDYLSLDKYSLSYIETLPLKFKQFDKSVFHSGEKDSSTEYLNIIKSFNKEFLTSEFPVHSFPALSLAATTGQTFEINDNNYTTGDDKIDETDETDDDSDDSTDDDSGDLTDDDSDDLTDDDSTKLAYTVEDIIKDDCFIDEDKLETMLERLEAKKNIILQGPPGTGKTWLARRLAYALIGRKDPDKVCAVQFHPNLSYEDFVCGWRPTGNGKLELVDGPFMQTIDKAQKHPNDEYVVVIEEINRGNPATIFGEMLTLTEADKRNASEALKLSYKDKPVYIPDNLYVIGTMNIADRSLALVDLALRRRFAFFDLEPTFNERWEDCLRNQFNFDLNLIEKIRDNVETLNETIAKAHGLGRQYRIGHSYFTPPKGSRINDPENWFKQICESEIRPLLEEYWYDNPQAATNAYEALIQLNDAR